jgi:hypothetical protein
MKHILNNLTEQEKNAIREQHTGGMKVATDKFSQLLESKLGDVKPILSEQIRSLWKRRFVKITNTEGKTLLFDVTEVETNSEGCKFTGDFRGNYDSVASFLGFEDLKSFIGITSNTQGKAHSFKFDCSAPATIMLNDADDMTYSSNPDGSSKFVGKSVKYTLDTEGQKELSNLCKCSRYK